MAITVAKGYTFGSTELVTNTKLHSLVDSATVSGANVTPYSTSFASGSLVSYLMSVPHNLATKFSSVTVWFTDNTEIVPNEVTVQDTNNLLLDLTSYASFASLCNVKVYP